MPIVFAPKLSSERSGSFDALSSYELAAITCIPSMGAGRSCDGYTHAAGDRALASPSFFGTNRNLTAGRVTAALAADHDFISDRIPAV